MTSIDETVRRTKERAIAAGKTVNVVPADSLDPVTDIPSAIRIRGSSVRTLAAHDSEELVDLEIEARYSALLDFSTEEVTFT